MLVNALAKKTPRPNAARLYTRSITMATAWKIHVNPQDTGLWKVKQTDDAAEKASELLQQDLEKHHVFFNDIGYHNHIVHHILSLYGTGAPAHTLQAGYDANTAYQRPTYPAAPHVVQDLQSWAHAEAYLGKGAHYPDFLAFFQRDIAARGWHAVLVEYLFAGTAAADDLLVRLFAGVMHPLIQLLFAMEWEQPALVAEALAQTCVHQPSLKELLFRAEADANAAYGVGKVQQGERRSMPRIVALLEEAKGDEKISTALRVAEEKGMTIQEWLFKRAPRSWRGSWAR